MAQEGQVATGPNGERAVFTNGQWIAVPTGAQPIAPIDPRVAPAVQGARLNNQGQAINNQVTQATAPTTIQTNQAPAGTMWVDPNDPSQGVVPIPGYTKPAAAAEINREDQRQGRQDRASVVKGLMGEVIRLYKQDLRGQPSERLFGLTEYFGTPKMERFTTAGETSLPLIRGMIAKSAREGDSNTELEIFRTYIPKNSDSDLAIEQKLRSMEILLRGLVDGIPPSASLAAPADTPLVDEALGFDREGNPYTPPPPRAAGAGATETSVPLPEGFQSAYNAFLRNWDGEPESYADFRVNLDKAYFPDQAQDQYGVYLEEGYLIGEQMRKGGPLDTQIPPAVRDLSSFEQSRNDLASSPVGTAAINYLDSAGFGGVSALDPQAMAALKELNPNAATIGQIGGAITGTAALGKLGRETAGRLAPFLLKGGGKGQFARNLGTDAIYSGVYGNNIGEDPLESAVLGTVGSAGGQAVGKIAGGVIGGKQISDATRYLRDRDIPLTTGQTLGGIPKGIEDRMAGLPVIGDIVNARRLEGLQEFNQQAFGDAGRSIGYSPKGIGPGAVDDLIGATGRAYDDATRGFRGPVDPQYTQDLAGIQSLVNRLPPDAIPAIDKIGANYALPITKAGEMTGDVFQNTQRALKIKRNKPPVGAQGFEEEWKNAVTGFMDANSGLVGRQGGEEVVSGLARADEAYRNAKIVQDAVGRAKGGSGSGELYTFTPSQLQGAVANSQKKFPGKTRLGQLADAGQEVLPSKVPDSGTAGRIATLALPGALVGGGAGAGALAGGGEGAQSGAITAGTLATALALFGTKGGQRRLNAILANRPEVMELLGRGVGRRAGLFGSGAIPMMVTNQSSQ